MIGEVPDEEYLIPLGLADVKREGSDVSIVAVAGAVQAALAAAMLWARRASPVRSSTRERSFPLTWRRS